MGKSGTIIIILLIHGRRTSVRAYMFVFRPAIDHPIRARADVKYSDTCPGSRRPRKSHATVVVPPKTAAFRCFIPNTRCPATLRNVVKRIRSFWFTFRPSRSAAFVFVRPIHVGFHVVKQQQKKKKDSRNTRLTRGRRRSAFSSRRQRMTRNVCAKTTKTDRHDTGAFRTS